MNYHPDHNFNLGLRFDRQHGFSLFELVVVVAIIATLASLALLGGRGMARANAQLELNGAARQLAGVVEVLRNDARRRRSGATLLITAEDAYEYTTDGNGDAHPDTVFVRLPRYARFAEAADLPLAVEFNHEGLPRAGALALPLTSSINQEAVAGILIAPSGAVVIEDNRAVSFPAALPTPRQHTEISAYSDIAR